MSRARARSSRGDGAQCSRHRRRVALGHDEQQRRLRLVERAASTANGTRSRSMPVEYTAITSVPSPVVPMPTHGTGSLTLARGTGGAAVCISCTPRRVGSMIVAQRRKRSAPRLIQRMRIGAECAVPLHDRDHLCQRFDRRAGAVNSRNASRSCTPTPTSKRTSPVIASLTTRQTSRPRTSPTSTPCSSTGSARAAVIIDRNCSCAGVDPDELRVGLCHRGRSNRSTACHTSIGVSNSAARRARCPTTPPSRSTRVRPRDASATRPVPHPGCVPATRRATPMPCARRRAPRRDRTRPARLSAPRARRDRGDRGRARAELHVQHVRRRLGWNAACTRRPRPRCGGWTASAAGSSTPLPDDCQ